MQAPPYTRQLHTCPSSHHLSAPGHLSLGLEFLGTSPVRSSPVAMSKQASMRACMASPLARHLSSSLSSRPHRSTRFLGCALPPLAALTRSA